MNIKKNSAYISKKQIFYLSIPVFFGNLAIPMAGIIDTALMGNLGEIKFLAAASIATSFMTMVICSFGFLRMGTVGIVAQLFGKGDYREIVKTLIRNFLICFVIAIIIILSKPILINCINHFSSKIFETISFILNMAFIFQFYEEWKIKPL